jgi:hypothetical protein
LLQRKQGQQAADVVRTVAQEEGDASGSLLAVELADESHVASLSCVAVDAVGDLFL